MLIALLPALGVDLIDVSSGGIIPKARIPVAHVHGGKDDAWANEQVRAYAAARWKLPPQALHAPRCAPFAPFCAARDGTVAMAQALVNSAEPGYKMADVAATDLAWRAVGVGACSAPFSVDPSARAIVVQPGATAQINLTLQYEVQQLQDLLHWVATLPADLSAGLPRPLTRLEVLSGRCPTRPGRASPGPT